jgi:hypothetical protein
MAHPLPPSAPTMTVQSHPDGASSGAIVRALSTYQATPCTGSSDGVATAVGGPGVTP